MAFEDDLQRVAGHGVPSTGDNLLGMEIDCYGLMFGISGVLDDSVRVVRCDGGDPMIDAECRCTPDSTPGDVAVNLEREWLPRIRYQFFESHRIRETPGGVQLDFVTQTGEGSLFVTGRVAIRS